jgi:hypothetical protein
MQDGTTHTSAVSVRASAIFGGTADRDTPRNHHQKKNIDQAQRND